MPNIDLSQKPATLTIDQALQQAIALHQTGRLQDADRLYRAILQTQPNHPDANHRLGLLAIQVNHPATALPHFKAALEACPSQGQYWLSYIDALIQADQTNAARQVLEQGRQRGLRGEAVEALIGRLERVAQVAGQSSANRSDFKETLTLSSTVSRSSKERTEIKPARPAKPARKSTSHKRKSPSPQELNTLIALFNEGRYIKAATLAQTMTERYPLHGFGWKVLGAAYKQIGRSADALVSVKRAVVLMPRDAESHSNLGTILQDLGRLEEADTRLRRALDINPDYAEAYSNLGNILQNLGRLDEAEAICRRALQIKPDFAEAYSNLGNILQNLGRLDEAEASCRRALQIKPDFIEAHINLGVALQDLGRLKEAETSYRWAVKIRPDLAEAHNNLGNVLRQQGRLDDAEASYRRVLEIKPDFVEAYINLGSIFQDLGRLDDAVASYRRALEIQPDFTKAHSNLLFLFGYHTLLDPQEYLSLARGWEQACVPAQDRQGARHSVCRSPGRRLKVGYVSGDYRQHAMSYFVEQLFAHHDKSRIELFAYSTQGLQDAVTERLQALVAHWVPLMGIPDASICERIEADSVDVLIDLSGHTKHNRLSVFARRAAPVQAHYLGYFASTGLAEMDYWIGDDILTPAVTDSHFSERVWRLPRVWVSYDGKSGAPVPNWRPTGNGTIWLGSFNNLGKLTPATLALWAKVLHALPDGRLLLKTKELADARNRQRILDAMATHGISPYRIELQTSSTTPDWTAHMAYYDRLDIALDPIGGVGGGTTTCDALWMGVPVISLEGDRMASRMTASMLNAIGRMEWTAHSEAEYIDKVVALARNVKQRKALRSTQRERMAASPLCDGRSLATALENAYFEMFERWIDVRSNEKK